MYKRTVMFVTLALPTMAFGYDWKVNAAHETLYGPSLAAGMEGASLSVGDIDQDGRDDIAVGFPSESSGATEGGAVQVFFESVTTAPARST